MKKEKPKIFKNHFPLINMSNLFKKILPLSVLEPHRTVKDFIICKTEGSNISKLSDKVRIYLFDGTKSDVIDLKEFINRCQENRYNFDERQILCRLKHTGWPFGRKGIDTYFSDGTYNFLMYLPLTHEEN